MVLIAGRAAGQTEQTADTLSIWEFDGTDWVERLKESDPLAPPEIRNRRNVSAFWNPARERVTLWGGDERRRASCTLSDSEIAASLAATASDPSGREALAATGCLGGYIHDTWEWDGTSLVPKTKVAYGGMVDGRPVFRQVQEGAVAWSTEGVGNALPPANSSMKSPLLAYRYDQRNEHFELRTRLEKAHMPQSTSSPSPNPVPPGSQGTPGQVEFASPLFAATSPADVFVGPSEAQVHVPGEGRAFAFDGAAWIERSTVTSPFANGTNDFFASTWDSQRQEAVVFDPVEGKTWTWTDGGGWHAQAVVSPPRWSLPASVRSEAQLPSQGHVCDPAMPWQNCPELQAFGVRVREAGLQMPHMAFDRARARTVMLYANGTWEWDGSAWSAQPGPASFTDCAAATLVAYDGARTRTVAFGCTVPGQTWEWDGSAWRGPFAGPNQALVGRSELLGTWDATLQLAWAHPNAAVESQALGGVTTIDGDGTLRTWNGSEWIAGPKLDLACRRHPEYYSGRQWSWELPARDWHVGGLDFIPNCLFPPMVEDSRGAQLFAFREGVDAMASLRLDAPGEERGWLPVPKQDTWDTRWRGLISPSPAELASPEHVYLATISDPASRTYRPSPSYSEWGPTSFREYTLQNLWWPFRLLTDASTGRIRLLTHRGMMWEMPTEPAKGYGELCTADTDCAEGTCSDQVCCNTKNCGDGPCSTCRGATPGRCEVKQGPLAGDLDGNPCTVHYCDGRGHFPLRALAAAGTECGDNDVCNGVETCNAAGACTTGAVPPQDDANPCTLDTCDPVAGIAHTPFGAGASCTDHNACNGAEVCDANAVCQPGTPLALDDGNPCTADACDPAAGVTHLALTQGEACEDTYGQTGKCSAKTACVPSVPPELDDHNPCTRDYANLQGEQHDPLPSGAPCADDDACNGDELCDGTGSCLAANPPVVDDGDPTTLDLCDYEFGVRHKRPSVIERVLPTSIADSNKFLYEGDDALQLGVAAGVIVRDHVAVIHGKVQARDGSALESVRVSVHEHPELGRTASRPDGAFEMVVNGGGPLTVSYEKSGYLPAQRRVQTGWREHGYADDVVMIPVDDVVTEIDPSSTSLQVAQASLQSDERGPRRTMLAFAGETAATMKFADGTTEPLDTLHVRATEYTVGATGRKAIPATMPSNASPTYVVELSVDEARSKGAVSTAFDKPVQVYVDNFMGFPAGTAVPFGYYDPAKAQWVPSDNGVVIKVLDVSGGIAQLDADGDDAADDTAQLDAIGLSDDERIELASLYNAGESLWRIPVMHFSTGAASWGYGPPDCAYGPGGKDQCDGTEHTLAWPRTLEGPAVRDELPAHGTGMSLVYESSRMPGDKRPFRLVVPMTGEELPTGLKRIDVLAAVAGKVYEERRTATANQTYTLHFTGEEWADRPVQGAQPIVVQLGYVYSCVIRDTPWYAGPGGPDRVSTQLPSGQDDCETTVWREWRGLVGAFDPTPQGIHGYSLSAHHAYDADSGMLYQGDGAVANLKQTGGAIELFAGAEGSGWNSDLLPAKGSLFSWIRGLAPAADGSVFVADTGNKRIVRIRPDGLVETVVSGVSAYALAVAPNGTLYYSAGVQVWKRATDGTISAFAGNGERCEVPSKLVPADPFLGYGTHHEISWESTFDCVVENAPATLSKLFDPMFLAVGPDSSLYIGTSVDEAVWKVLPTGTIEHVFGNLRVGKLPGMYADGLATQSAAKQRGGLAVSSAGELLLVDWGNRDPGRIVSVADSGMAETIVGSGCDKAATPFNNGDNGPPLNACLTRPNQLAAGPDGSVYVVDYGPSPTNSPYVHARIRRVHPNESITTVVDTNGWNGDPVACVGDYSTSEERSWARPIAVGPDGSLYWANGCWNQRIMRIKPGAKKKGDDLRVPSADGSRVFVFDEQGGHKRTENAWLGTTVATFDRNDKSELTAVHDAFGNTTSVQRSGAVAKLVNRFDGVTKVTPDPSGYMMQHVDPALGATSLGIDTSGMLGTRSNTVGSSTSVFGPQGSVQSITDSAGSKWTMSESGDGTKQVVNMVSALGFAYEYTTLFEQSGAVEVQSKTPWNTTTTARQEPDNTWSLGTPDRMTVTGTPKAHPEFGKSAPYLAILTTKTPLQLTRVDETEVTFAPTGGGGASGSGDDGEESIPEWKQVRTRVNQQGWATTLLRLSTGAIETTTPAGRTSVFHLDAHGQTRRVEIPSVHPTRYSYYTDGRLQKVEQGPDGQPGRTAQYFYDDQHRITTIVDASGSVLAQLDELRRPTRVQLPDSEFVAMGYDQASNLTSITPPGRPEHKMQFKGGQLFEAYVPPMLQPGVSQETRRAFDLDNKTDHVTYPDGRTLQFTYDDAGRLTNTSDGEESTTLAYDWTTGQLSGEASPDQVVSYEFDGALVRKEKWTGVVDAEIERSFFATFDLMNESIKGLDVGYVYDSDGLPTMVGMETITWAPTNALLVGTNVGNIQDNFAYSDFGELSTYSAVIIGSTPGDPSPAPFYKKFVTRDALGRVSTKAETVQGVTSNRRYTYWPRGWLKEVWNVEGQTETLLASYTYDANGNRRDGAADYDVQDRLASANGRNYEYGNRGDLTKVIDPAPAPNTARPETTFHYLLSGALSRVQLPGGTVIEYVSDPSGRRIAKLRDGTYEDRFIYRSALQPGMWWDKAGNAWRLVYGTARNVPEYMTDGTTTYRLVTDEIGSLRVVINASSGEVVQTMMHDEWGVVTEDWCTPGWECVPFGFAGGIYDRDTRLVRFGARDYDPAIGRWTSKDPLLFGGGDSNLYLYAGGDPVNRVDPSGEVAPLLVAGVLAGVLFGFGTSAMSDSEASLLDVGVMSMSLLPLRGLAALSPASAARGGAGKWGGLADLFAEEEGLTTWQWEKGRGIFNARAVNIRVSFDPALEGAALKDTLYHEFTHVAQLQRAPQLWRIAKLNPAFAPVTYGLEVHAWARGALAAGRYGRAALSPLLAFGSLSGSEIGVMGLYAGGGYAAWRYGLQ